MPCGRHACPASPGRPISFLNGGVLRFTPVGPRRSGRLHGHPWPGDADTVDATRANPDGVADRGIDDVTDHYAKIIDGLSAQPILIGYSFGA